MIKIKKSNAKISEISTAFEADIFEVIYEEMLSPNQYILKQVCSKEEHEWIEWWLYEDVKKIVTLEDGKTKLNLTNANELYEFLKTVN